MNRRPDDNDNRSPDAGRLKKPETVVISLPRSVIDDSDDLRTIAERNRLNNLSRLLASGDVKRYERVIRHVPPEVLRRRESLAPDSARAQPSLTGFWRLYPATPAGLGGVLRQLKAMLPDELEMAYAETAVIEASASAPYLNAGDPYLSKQLALRAAPQGIDAFAAWDKRCGHGEDVNVIDLERGWIVKHEDMPNFTRHYGDNRAENDGTLGNHGAAARSIVVSQPNPHGLVGIAPALASLDVVSHHRASDGSDFHVADAIDAATKFLGYGDILYLEVQRIQQENYYPVEIDAVDRAAIIGAIEQGIIVIEAAGNEGISLDAWQDPEGKHSLDPSSGLFTDTGAILVGSGKSQVTHLPNGVSGHERYWTSNHGKRVNCYALGDSIHAAGYGSLSGTDGGPDSYTRNFGETSGATAIIAGAAAVVQSWYKACCGPPLGPAAMRALLSNTTINTPQVLTGNEPIGVMPNLAAIMTSTRRIAQILLCVLGRVRTGGADRIDRYAEFKVSRTQRRDKSTPPPPEDLQ